MTSQTEQQINTIYILPSISRRIGKQSMKFGQLIKYNMTNAFLKKSCRKWIQTFFCFLKKLYIMSTQVFSTFVLTIWTYSKNKLYNISDCWSRNVYFLFWIKSLGLASSVQFADDFARKIFHMLCSINWPYFNDWLSILLEILSNMYIKTICCSVCDVINFDINLSFLIKSFFYLT